MKRLTSTYPDRTLSAVALGSALATTLFLASPVSALRVEAPRPVTGKASSGDRILAAEELASQWWASFPATLSYAFGEGGATTTVTGTVLQPAYDPLGRLTSTTVTPGPGVVGPVTEGYAYDALGRVTQATHGGVTTTYRYDSLGRLLSETLGSDTVTYAYDPSGNPTSTGYPAGSRAFTGIEGSVNRLRDVSFGTDEAAAVQAASFTYRGPGLVAGKTLGPSGSELAGTITYGPGRLLQSIGFGDSFSQSVAWTGRALRSETLRGDLNRAGLSYDYDGAGRLALAERVQGQEGQASWTRPFQGLPDRYGFAYDVAENLTAKTAELACEQDALALPLDGSGRNRPGSLGGMSLEWNANGNLSRRGDRYLHYDYQDRLVKVTDGPDPDNSAERVSYVYDAQGRRVSRTVDGVKHSTRWAGWQAIEEYVDGALTVRRIYGLGLDEVVRLEIDVDEDGTLGASETYLPIYDASGSLAVVARPDGTVVERYEYSPYGDRSIFVNDFTGPMVKQVRFVGGEIWVDLSEEVRLMALGSGGVTLRNLTKGLDGTVAISQPVLPGRAVGRRLLFALDGEPEVEPWWPESGDQLELVVPEEALVDTFGNTAASGLTQVVEWGSGDALLADTASPEVEQVCVLADGRLEVELSETVDVAAIGGVATVDGAAVAWTVSPDGFVATSEPLAEGPHTLSLSTASLDLDGKELEVAFSRSFAVAGGQSQAVHVEPWPGQVATSSIGNVLGFHGLPLDPETGLVYARHRYYDPEMGRFISTDPLGYVDGPNPYQYGLNNPVNYSDPMGLSSADIMLRQRDERLLNPATRGQQLADREAGMDATLHTLANPYVQGGLQVVGGCLEAGLGAAAALGSPATAGGSAIPGAIMLAHGTDLCGTGLTTLATGETQDPLFVKGVRGGLVGVGMSHEPANWVATGVDIGAGVGASAGLARSLRAGVVAPRSAPRGLSASRSAAELRASPGVAVGSGRNISGRWLRGSQGNAGLIPEQIASRLQGRQFRNFDHFRGEFWRTVANDHSLAAQFSKANVTRMQRGYAPIAPRMQHFGRHRSYILHHRTPIHQGGGVFDLENLLVTSPRYHHEVLSSSYHFRGKRYDQKTLKGRSCRTSAAHHGG